MHEHKVKQSEDFFAFALNIIICERIRTSKDNMAYFHCCQRSMSQLMDLPSTINSSFKPSGIK